MLLFGIHRPFDGTLDKERAFALHDYIMEFYIVYVHAGVSTVLAYYANTGAGFPYHQITQHCFADNARTVFFYWNTPLNYICQLYFFFVFVLSGKTRPSASIPPLAMSAITRGAMR